MNAVRRFFRGAVTEVTRARWNTRQRWMILFAFYAVLVYAGAESIVLRTLFCATKANYRLESLPLGVLDEDRVRYVAARPLPRNHFLTAADLVPDPELPRGTDLVLPDRSAYLNRWLVRERKRYEVIRKSDVANAPVIDLIAQTAVVVATMPVDLTARLIDAGTVVDLVAASKVQATGQTIARECSGDKCIVLVRVTSAEAAALAATGATPAAVVRSIPSVRSASMDEPKWTTIKKLKVPARPGGYWTLALDFVEPKTKLKLEAGGKWKYDDTHECGPDGDLSAAAPASLLVADAPIGALVLKHGGSTVGKADGKTFPVGRYATYVAADDAKGALFVTINTVPGRFPENGGELELTIYGVEGPYQKE